MKIIAVRTANEYFKVGMHNIESISYVTRPPWDFFGPAFRVIYTTTGDSDHTHGSWIPVTAVTEVKTLWDLEEE
jgi:hypothetical protein